MKYLKNLSLTIALAGLLFGAVSASAGENWLHDYDQALAQAKAEGKYVLVEFHGSDWCPPCIKLNKEVLSNEAFKSLADEKLVLVEADFPRRKELPAELKVRNTALAQKFGIEYFPTVLIIDEEGQVLDKMVGFPQGGLDGFLKFITDKTDS